MCRCALLCLWPGLLLADEPSIQPALAAAQRRDEQIKTVSVRWKVTTFVPKGARLEADATGLPLPRSDQTVESTHLFVSDGSRFRAERHSPVNRDLFFRVHNMDVAYDGERWFGRYFVDGRDRPAQFEIDRPKEVGYLGDITSRPVTLWCRRKAWWEFATATPPARTVTNADVNGVPCLEVRLGHPKTSPKNTWFLAVGSDYLVRRIQTEGRDFVEVTDVEYREEPNVGWVPTGWTTVKRWTGGKLVHRIRAEVTEVRQNEPVPPETFRLSPLPGETFTDLDAKKTYHVRDDGTLEEIDLKGVPVTVPDPPRRSAPQWPGRSLVRFVLLPALAAAVIGGMILRRRRRPPDTPSS